MTEKAIEAAAKTIPALIEKLRGLEGPSPELDAEIWAEFDFMRETRQMDRNWPALVPTYTASPDAVVALIEREMPKCLCDMNTFGAAAIYPNWLIGDVDTKYAATAETPALALLIAFLEAKMEIGE